MDRVVARADRFVWDLNLSLLLIVLILRGNPQVLSAWAEQRLIKHNPHVIKYPSRGTIQH